MAELNGNEFSFIVSQLKLRKNGRLSSQNFLLGLYQTLNLRKYSFISNTSGNHHVEDFVCKAGQKCRKTPFKDKGKPLMSFNTFCMTKNPSWEESWSKNHTEAKPFP